MGLNLNIRRIIFTTTDKLTKGKTRQLEKYHVKQIAGRAGRYVQDGLVNAFSKRDLGFVRS